MRATRSSARWSRATAPAAEPVLVLFSNRLGCLGSVLVSLVLTAVVVGLVTLL